MPTDRSLMTSPRKDTSREHVLLTVLGTGSKSAIYSLGDRCVQSTLAPVALLQLLPEGCRPDRLFAICTPEAAKETWPALLSQLEHHNEECQSIQIKVPSASDQAHIDEFLRMVANAVPTNTDLTVDVTHGFRHYSFLTYVAVQFLTALRGVRVRGAYYGLLGQDPGGTSPFLDLRPLLELPRWTHALEVLNETGSALPIAAALGQKAVKSQTDRNISQSPSPRIAESLSHFSEGYLSGLPMEAGRKSRIFLKQHCKPMKRLLKSDHRIPLADDLIEELTTVLSRFALATDCTGRGWKQHVCLSEEELKRQARMIDDLMGRGHIAVAIGLMNEWTVTWAILRLFGDETAWLDYQNVRRKAARVLDAVRALNREPTLRHHLTVHQAAFGEFWSDLAELRNGYHHHGMRPQVLVDESKACKQLCRVLKYWREILRSCPEVCLSIGHPRRRRVLISSMGLRPGVLFSALHACRDTEGEPDLCLVLCSKETQGKIASAIDHSNFAGEVQCLVLDDPFTGGPSEIKRLTRQARNNFIGADRVLVNVTGGTTLMGIAVDNLCNAARRLGCAIRRFGLIDRRSPEIQDADPFQIGEPLWLGDDDADCY